MPIINVENAQIKTAAVEIKTLTISGKQVTLSVFKQITVEDLIDLSSMKLNGIPWGNVNYFWGENKDYDNNRYFHTLWQKGNDLRRSIICKDAHRMNCKLNDFYDIRSDEAGIVFLEDKEAKECHSDYARHSFTYNLARIDELIISYSKMIKISNEESNYCKDLKKNRENFNKLREENIIELKDMRERYFTNKKIIEDSMKKFIEIEKSLSSLPHLFIAI